MKKLTFLALCIFTLISCKKSVLSTPSSIEYKVNGSLVQITGGRDYSSQSSVFGVDLGPYVYKSYGSGYYSITGLETTYGASIAIGTGHDSLQTKTYTGGTLSVNFVVNNVSYGIINIQDSILVNITRYSSGSIDGTFSGSFSHDSLNRISVTEGKLNNLKVYF